MCQWQVTLFDLGVPGPTTALNAGRWAGDPRWATCRRHVAGPAPLPLQGRHVAAPDPFLGGGGSRPPRPVGAVWPVMVRPSHVAAPDPWGVRVRRGYLRAPLPSWACGGPGPLRARGRSGDHGPSCQARAVCHVTQKTRGRSRMVIR
jgi:hypothetical protein